MVRSTGVKKDRFKKHRCEFVKFLRTPTVSEQSHQVFNLSHFVLSLTLERANEFLLAIHERFPQHYHFVFQSEIARCCRFQMR